MSLHLCSSSSNSIHSSIKRSSLKNFYTLRCKTHLQFRSSATRIIEPLKPTPALDLTISSIRGSGFFTRRRLGFSVGAGNGKGGVKKVVDEFEEARRESTTPSRFRHLIREAPDRLPRWPFFIVFGFLVYAWRMVLWELSNYTKLVVGTAKFVLATLVNITADRLVFVFGLMFGIIETSLIMIRASVDAVQSAYINVVASAPVPELAVIVLLTTVVLAIAEATVPESVNCQPFLLTVAGMIALAAVKSIIPEILLWAFLVCLFLLSKFVKKRDNVSSMLPSAAVLTAIGTPLVRLLVMGSYISLAIYQHSTKPLEETGKVKPVSTARRLPLPLLAAALAIGMNLGTRWLHYRHLTWMMI